MAFALTEFPNYYLNRSVCASSRVTMFTGLTASHHGVQGNSQAVTWEAANGNDALSRWLRRAGYRNALFGKYLNRVVTDTFVGTAWDEWRAMVDDANLGGGHTDHGMRYINFWLSINGVLTQITGGDTWVATGYSGIAAAARIAVGGSGYMADWANRRTQLWLDTVPREPWYLDIGLWNPHGDADADNKPIPATRHAAASFSATHNASWNEADVTDKPKWVSDTVPSSMTSPQQTWADEYDVQTKRCLLSVDELLYDVIAKLTTLGLIDRTAIFICADNGAMIGEHRLTYQTAGSVKNMPYQPSVWSRLFAYIPAGVRRPNILMLKLDDTARHHFDAMTWLTSQVTTTNTALVGNIDLCPTICELAGARPSIRPDGMSLVPLLDGRISAANFRDQLLLEYDGLDDSSVSELPDWKGVIKADGRKYVRYAAKGGDPAEVEFYDSAAVAADEMVASNTTQADLESAITGMVQG